MPWLEETEHRKRTPPDHLELRLTSLVEDPREPVAVTGRSVAEMNGRLLGLLGRSHRASVLGPYCREQGRRPFLRNSQDLVC